MREQLRSWSGSWHPAPVVRCGVIGLLIGCLTGVAGCAGGQGAPQWRTAGPTATTTATAAPSPTARQGTISFSATGDIIMGSAPDRLPAAGGKGFFAAVRASLAADLVMGNLEEPLTEDTGHSKCEPAPASAGPSATPTKDSGCHQFRVPPDYAAHLRDAGFMLLNQANNHSHDYGNSGYDNTQKALEKYDMRYTGAKDEVTVAPVRGLRVAVIGFSPYAWSNTVSSIGTAKKLVARAAEDADLVIVQAHMGAEGSAMTRVKPGTEMFLGENRGDPVKFSHAVIDAGADLVVGHGPHVLRGMEFYKDRLIAYSLGNFAGGGGTLSAAGKLGWGGILRVSLREDGSFDSGQFVSTYMNGAGKPTLDSQRRGLKLVDELCDKDFPGTRVALGDEGAITTAAA